MTGTDYSLYFTPLHNEDISGAKYKIGEEVIVKHLGKVFNSVISGVANPEPNVYEYSVEGYHYLLWEDDISPRIKTVKTLNLDTKKES